MVSIYVKIAESGDDGCHNNVHRLIDYSGRHLKPIILCGPPIQWPIVGYRCRPLYSHREHHSDITTLSLLQEV